MSLIAFLVEKPMNMKKDNKHLIGMELRETERNYVTMLSNIIRVRATIDQVSSSRVLLFV